MIKDFVGVQLIIVEDEPLIAMSLEDMLQQLGCEVIAATGSVSEAQILIDNNKPDIVFLDYTLEDGTAQPIAGQLAALYLPFILMSAQAQQVLGSLPVEPAAIFPKPFEYERLPLVLRSVLELRSRESAGRQPRPTIARATH